jgi:hypothetical protein
MLGVKTYKRDYITACRKKLDADVAAYGKLPSAAKKASDFETAFFNNMVLVLDHLFVHRLRTVEGKDGNPLNEVRVLGDSLMEHNGVLTPEKSIKLAPERSVLKLEPGDKIALTESQFVLLADSFFDEIKSKFS